LDNLLDVNVLVALLWPRHVMHPAARNWFQHQAVLGTVWATCALTEAGFVRVLSNPAVNQGTLTPLRVTEVLEENLRRPGHRFWAMDLNWPEAARLSGVGVESYQQVTDIYLIGLAVKNKGQLVTFDKSLGKLSKHVLLLG
jgi:hypothetical protein